MKKVVYLWARKRLGTLEQKVSTFLGNRYYVLEKSLLRFWKIVITFLVEEKNKLQIRNGVKNVNR